MIDDHPVRAALPINEAVPCRDALCLPILQIREGVVAAVDRDVAIDPDHLLAEGDLVSRKRLERPLEVAAKPGLADEQRGGKGPPQYGPVVVQGKDRIRIVVDEDRSPFRRGAGDLLVRLGRLARGRRRRRQRRHKQQATEHLNQSERPREHHRLLLLVVVAPDVTSAPSGSGTLVLHGPTHSQTNVRPGMVPFARSRKQAYTPLRNDRIGRRTVERSIAALSSARTRC